jgi:DNA-binding NarL/FixJ family response regulator
MTAPRLLVLHSQLLVAQVVAARLASDQRFTYVESRDDPAADLHRLEDFDLLLVDQHFIGPAGARLLERLRGASRPVLAVLGEPDELDGMLSALRAGAKAWVSIDSSGETVIEALQTALDGQVWLPPAALPTLLEALAAKDLQLGLLQRLTVQETEVMRHLLDGESTVSIARRMFLSPNTVRTYRRRIFSKLGVHSALEAVAAARAAGMTPISPGGRYT